MAWLISLKEWSRGDLKQGRGRQGSRIAGVVESTVKVAVQFSPSCNLETHWRLKRQMANKRKALLRDFQSDCLAFINSWGFKGKPSPKLVLNRARGVAAAWGSQSGLMGEVQKVLGWNK